MTLRYACVLIRICLHHLLVFFLASEYVHIMLRHVFRNRSLYFLCISRMREKFESFIAKCLLTIYARILNTWIRSPNVSTVVRKHEASFICISYFLSVLCKYTATCIRKSKRKKEKKRVHQQWYLASIV